MELKYLSPSSMKDWTRCAERFKLMRLEGRKIPRVTTFNQNVGTAFDAHVKVRLNRRLELPVLLKEVTDEKAINMGALLCQIYDKTGALQALIDEGVGQVEIDKEFFINGVPVYGKPDYTMRDGAIGDWKTSLQGSPRPGYSKKRKWLLGLGITQEEPAHERANDPLDQIDESWAFQLTMYAFLLGHKPGHMLKARIEHLVVQANSVVVASYNNFISQAFQEVCWNLPKTIWESIQKMEIPRPIYDERRCFMYGQKCEVAHLCSAFQALGGTKIEDNPSLLLGDML